MAQLARGARGLPRDLRQHTNLFQTIIFSLNCNSFRLNMSVISNKVSHTLY